MVTQPNPNFDYEHDIVQEFDFKALNVYSEFMHISNQKWWKNPGTGEWIERNNGELIALIHSEVSEALEGFRKDKMDDHLPHRKAAEVELADVLIRIFDLAGARGFDLAGAVREKTIYNRQRADHSLAARAAAGGKKF